MDNLKLIHLHIFKNGGSTFDSVLKKNFGHFFSEFHGPEANSSLFNSDILNFFNKFPLARALSSHHFRFPILSDASSSLLLFPITFLRHPIDRIYSIYAHEQRHVLTEQEKQNFKSWLQHALDERPYLVGDAQTNLFADGGTYYEVPDYSAFQRAMAFLTSLEYCGVVEEYNLSMIALEDKLSSHDLAFDGAYQQQNSAPDRQMNLSARLKIIKEQAGSFLYDRLRRNNAYDLQLYESATEKLFKQISSIQRFANKKQAFEDRMQSTKTPEDAP